MSDEQDGVPKRHLRVERRYPREPWDEGAELRTWARAFNEPASSSQWDPEREKHETISQAEAWRRVLHWRFLMQLQVDLSDIRPPTRSSQGAPCGNT